MARRLDRRSHHARGLQRERLPSDRQDHRGRHHLAGKMVQGSCRDPGRNHARRALRLAVVMAVLLQLTTGPKTGGKKQGGANLEQQTLVF